MLSRLRTDSVLGSGSKTTAVVPARQLHGADSHARRDTTPVRGTMAAAYEPMGPHDRRTK